MKKMMQMLEDIKKMTEDEYTARRPFNNLSEPVDMFLESTVMAPVMGVSLVIVGATGAAIGTLGFLGVRSRSDIKSTVDEIFDCLKVTTAGLGMIAFAPVIGILSILSRTLFTFMNPLLASHNQAPAAPLPAPRI